MLTSPDPKWMQNSAWQTKIYIPSPGRSKRYAALGRSEHQLQPTVQNYFGMQVFVLRSSLRLDHIWHWQICTTLQPICGDRIIGFLLRSYPYITVKHCTLMRCAYLLEIYPSIWSFQTKRATWRLLLLICWALQYVHLQPQYNLIWVLMMLSKLKLQWDAHWTACYDILLKAGNLL